MNAYNDLIDNKKDYLTQKQFCDMHNYISFFFVNDQEFEDLVENTWKQFYDYDRKNHTLMEKSQKVSRLLSAPYDLDERLIDKNMTNQIHHNEEISSYQRNKGLYAGK